MNNILIGKSYIADGEYGTFVIATNQDELDEVSGFIHEMYTNIREVQTEEKYQPQDMFCG